MATNPTRTLSLVFAVQGNDVVKAFKDIENVAKQAKVEVSGFTSSYNSATNQLTTNIQATSSSAKEAETRLRAFHDTVKNLQIGPPQPTTSFSNYLKDLQKTYQDNAKTFKEFSKQQTDTLNQQLALEKEIRLNGANSSKVISLKAAQEELAIKRKLQQDLLDIQNKLATGDKKTVSIQQKNAQDLINNAKVQITAIRQTAEAQTSHARATEEAARQHKNLFTRVIEITSAYELYRIAVNSVKNALLSIPSAGLQEQATKAAVTAVFGSVEGNKNLQFLKDLAEGAGQYINDLETAYRRFAPAARLSGASQAEVNKTFKDFTEVSTVLHFTTDQVRGLYLALEQMYGKTVVQSEEIKKQLGNVLPGAVEIGAKAMGLSVKKFMEAMKNNEILAREFVPKFAALYRSIFGGVDDSVFLDIRTKLFSNLNRLQNQYQYFSREMFAITGETLNNIVKLGTNALQTLNENLRGTLQIIEAIGVALSLVATRFLLFSRVKQEAGKAVTVASPLLLFFDKIKSIFTYIVGLITPIRLAIAGIVALAGYTTLALSNSEVTYKKFVPATEEEIKFLKEKLEYLKKGTQEYETTLETLDQINQASYGSKEFIIRVKSELDNASYDVTFSTITSSIWKAISNGTKNGWNEGRVWFQDYINFAKLSFHDTFKNIFISIGAFSKEFLDNFKNGFTRDIEGLKAIIEGLSVAWNKIKTPGVSFGAGIAAGVSAAGNAYKEGLQRQQDTLLSQQEKYISYMKNGETIFVQSLEDLEKAASEGITGLTVRVKEGDTWKYLIKRISDVKQALIEEQKVANETARSNQLILGQNTEVGGAAEETGPFASIKKTLKEGDILKATAEINLLNAAYAKSKGGEENFAKAISERMEAARKQSQADLLEIQEKYKAEIKVIELTKVAYEELQKRKQKANKTEEDITFLNDPENQKIFQQLENNYKETLEAQKNLDLKYQGDSAARERKQFETIQAIREEEFKHFAELQDKEYKIAEQSSLEKIAALKNEAEQGKIAFTDYYKQREEIYTKLRTLEGETFKSKIAKAVELQQPYETTQALIEGIKEANAKEDRNIELRQQEVITQQKEYNKTLEQTKQKFYEIIGATELAKQSRGDFTANTVLAQAKAILDSNNASAEEKNKAQEALTEASIISQFEQIDALTEKTNKYRDAINEVRLKYLNLGATASDVVNSQLGGFSQIFTLFDQFTKSTVGLDVERQKAISDLDVINQKIAALGQAQIDSTTHPEVFESLVDANKVASAKIREIDKETFLAKENLARDTIGVIASLFKENTKAAKAAQVAQAAVNAAEKFDLLQMIGLNVVAGATKQATDGDPYTAFARVGAMLALLASIASLVGVSVGGNISGSKPAEVSEGKGTVLGDKNQPSESITNVMQLLVDIGYKQYRQLIGIYNAIAKVNGSVTQIGLSAITGAALTPLNLNLAPQSLFKTVNNLAHTIDGIFAGPLGVTFSKALDGINKFLIEGIFGKTTYKITDAGIQTSINSVKRILGGMSVLIAQFNTIEATTKSWFGSSKKTFDIFSEANKTAVSLFTQLYLNAANAGKELASKFGPEFVDKILSYKFPAIKVSLQDKTPKEIIKTLNSVMSAELDRMTNKVFKAQFKQYQDLSEGMFETVSRLYAENVVVGDLFKKLKFTFPPATLEGAKFAEQLIRISSSAEKASERFKEFVQQLQDFYDAFTSDEQKLTDTIESFVSQILTVFEYSAAGTAQIVADKLKVIDEAYRNTDLLNNASQGETLLQQSQELSQTVDTLQKVFYETLLSSESFSDAILAVGKAIDTSTEAGQQALSLLTSPAFTDAAKKIRDFYNSVTNPIEDQINTIAATLDTKSIEDYFDILAKSSDPNEQKKITDRLRTLIVDKYNTEVNAIKTVKQAFADLQATINQIKLSDLSTLNPYEKLQEAKRQFDALVLQAKSSDATVAAQAAGKISAAAQTYLQEAKNYFAATAGYAAIYNEVIATLEDLKTIAEKDTSQEIIDATRKLAEDAMSQLEKLRLSFTTAFESYVNNQQAIVKAAEPPAPEKTLLETLIDKLAGAEGQDKRNILKQIKAYQKGGEELYNQEILREQKQTELEGKQTELRSTKDTDKRETLKKEIRALQAYISSLDKVIGFKADGGLASGYTVVGERGPELLHLPTNTNVLNNQTTNRMLTAANKDVIISLREIREELKSLNDKTEDMSRKIRLGGSNK
jgi:tape measure domain-containing protein